MTSTNVGDLAPTLNKSAQRAVLLHVKSWGPHNWLSNGALSGDDEQSHGWSEILKEIRENGCPELILDLNEFYDLAYQFVAHAHVTLVAQMPPEGAAIEQNFRELIENEFGDWISERNPRLRTYAHLDMYPFARAFFGRGVFNPDPERDLQIGRLDLRSPDGTRCEPLLSGTGSDPRAAGFYHGQRGVAFSKYDINAPAFAGLSSPELTNDDVFYFGQVGDLEAPSLLTWKNDQSYGELPKGRSVTTHSDDATEVAVTPKFRMEGKIALDAAEPAKVFRNNKELFQIRWVADVQDYALTSRPPDRGLALGLLGIILPQTKPSWRPSLPAAQALIGLRDTQDTPVARAWFDLSPDLFPVSAPLIPRRYSVAVRDGSDPYLYNWQSLERVDIASRAYRELVPPTLEHGYLTSTKVPGDFPRWHSLIMRKSPRDQGAIGRRDRDEMFGYVALPDDLSAEVRTEASARNHPSLISMDWLDRAGGVIAKGAVVEGLASRSIGGMEVRIQSATGGLQVTSFTRGDRPAPPVAAFIRHGELIPIEHGDELDVRLGGEFIVGPYLFRLVRP